MLLNVNRTDNWQTMAHRVARCPVLAADRYKGQAGKIGVIGGCREYTGAPFFASISALKVPSSVLHDFSWSCGIS